MINYESKKWMSLTEASRLRGVKKQTMSYLVKKGRFEAHRVGSNVFLLREEVERYEPDRGGRPSKRKNPGGKAVQSLKKPDKYRATSSEHSSL